MIKILIQIDDKGGIVYDIDKKPPVTIHQIGSALYQFEKIKADLMAFEFEPIYEYVKPYDEEGCDCEVHGGQD